MVVAYLNVAWSWLTVEPLKANTPLLVDANGVLPCSVSSQRFKSIAWQGAQGVERWRSIEYGQPLGGLVLEALERFDERTARKSFRFLVSIAQDHLLTSISALTMYVKRQYDYFVCIL